MIQATFISSFSVCVISIPFLCIFEWKGTTNFTYHLAILSYQRTVYFRTFCYVRYVRCFMLASHSYYIYSYYLFILYIFILLSLLLLWQSSAVRIVIIISIFRTVRIPLILCPEIWNTFNMCVLNVNIARLYIWYLILYILLTLMIVFICVSLKCLKCYLWHK